MPSRTPRESERATIRIHAHVPTELLSSVDQLSKDTREKIRDRVREDRGDVIVENEEGSAALPISNRDRAMYVGVLIFLGAGFKSS
ncbi:MAG: hypothetical protein ACXWNB_09040 [Candidatus Binataceae bacterium]